MPQQPDSLDEREGYGGAFLAGSLGLRRSFGDRLRARLTGEGEAGSGHFRVRRTPKATLRGRPFVRLSASAPKAEASEDGSPIRGWQTPRATEGMGRYGVTNGRVYPKLWGEAQLSGWPTPTSATSSEDVRTPEGAEKEAARGHWSNDPDARSHSAATDAPVRIAADGSALTGAEAGMPEGGQMDPAHPRWLMGFPAAWDAAPEDSGRPRRGGPS